MCQRCGAAPPLGDTVWETAALQGGASKHHQRSEEGNETETIKTIRENHPGIHTPTQKHVARNKREIPPELPRKVAQGVRKERGGGGAGRSWDELGRGDWGTSYRRKM